jgi:hypothetical protein
LGIETNGRPKAGTLGSDKTSFVADLDELRGPVDRKRAAAEEGDGVVFEDKAGVNGWKESADRIGAIANDNSVSERERIDWSQVEDGADRARDPEKSDDLIIKCEFGWADSR